MTNATPRDVILQTLKAIISAATEEECKEILRLIDKIKHD